MSQKSFPRQDIPEKDKGEQWIKSHQDYAQFLLQNFSAQRKVLSDLFMNYNGQKSPLSVNWLQQTYGKQNRAKYITYKKGRNKLNVIEGEYLRMPLRATVVTTNSEAKSKKLEQLDFMSGAMAAKDALMDLKDKAGVDVMNGVQIPESEEDPVWQKMSVKDKNEKIMQIILNEEIKNLDLKKKLAMQLKHCCIGSYCFGKIEITKEGDLVYDWVDPRDAIFEEIEGDDFLEKTPIKGARIMMTVNDIIRKWPLNETQRNKLEQLKSSPSKYKDTTGWPRTYFLKNEVCVNVTHIQWKSVRAFYFKKSPKTKAQLEYDSSTTHYRVAIDTKYYEENKAKFDKDVADGKYEIEIEWAEDAWESVRLGDEMDLFGRRVENQMRKFDTPTRILDLQYVGFLLGTVDGVRISLQQIISNFDNMFDIVMFQILKDLNRAKGKVLAFNRGAFPAKKSIKEIVYDAVNDGFIELDTSADGNRAQQNFNLNDLIQEKDWGLSNSFQSLVALKAEIERTMDDLTGITKEREGDIAASATVTNTQQNTAASRTITEPLFFGFNQFVEKLLMKIVESAKVVWAFYKAEKGEQILGSKEHAMLVKITRDIGYCDYGVHLEDAQKFFEVKQRLAAMADASLNAKEIRMLDILKMEVAETLAEKKAILLNAWDEINKVRSQQAQEEQQMAAQAKQEQMAMQAKMMETDAGLKGENALRQIDAKGKMQMQIDNNKGKAALILDQNKHDNEELKEKNNK